MKLVLTGAGNPEPSSESDEWVSAIRAGDFDRAWALSDRHLAKVCRSGLGKHEGPRHLQRIWRGEDLAEKTVLVRCYHGLGDTIQFIRFARLLRNIAREVVVWCQPELISLIERVDGVDRVLPLHEGGAHIDFDVDIEIMEIPHALRVTRDQVEMREPYLALSHQSVAPPLSSHGGLAIGLVWEVGALDNRRSIPGAELKRLNVPGISLFSLQRGSAAKAAADIGATDISTPDLETLGHRLRALDLMICPDTMVAHLAGALGCETWILLHSDCDWRWPAIASETYWYPTVRLFHQPASGDWSHVVDEILAALGRPETANA